MFIIINWFEAYIQPYYSCTVEFSFNTKLKIFMKMSSADLTANYILPKASNVSPHDHKNIYILYIHIYIHHLGHNQL